MKLVLGIFAAGLSALIVGGIALFQDDSADRGKEVYAVQKCALCHSISGAGGAKAPLDGVGARLKPEEVRKWIRTPKSMKSDTTMKSYPDLPEKDLDALVAYLLTLR